MEIEQRFVGLERQISEIIQRLDREGELKNSAETEAFLLQRENENLKDENLALRLEIVDLEEIIKKNSEERSEKKGLKTDVFLHQNQENNISEKMYLNSKARTIPRDDLWPTSRFSTLNQEREDPWQFPKRSTKSNHFSATSFETANRFKGLEDYEITDNKPFESSKTSSARVTIDKEITSPKPTRNVVPGSIATLMR